MAPVSNMPNVTWSVVSIGPGHFKSLLKLNFISPIYLFKESNPYKLIFNNLNIKFIAWSDPHLPPFNPHLQIIKITCNLFKEMNTCAANHVVPGTGINEVIHLAALLYALIKQ